MGWAIVRCREPILTKGLSLLGYLADEYAAYTESPDAYQRNMERLQLKWQTARSLVPKAEINGRGGRLACCSTAPRRYRFLKRWINWRLAGFIRHLQGARVPVW